MTTRFFSNADENTLPGKYLLTEVNLSLGAFLRTNRGSNIPLYPDDWIKFPVPAVSPVRQARIDSLVKQIRSAGQKSSGADLTEWEAESDLLVRELYGMPEKEIPLAEGKA